MPNLEVYFARPMIGEEEIANVNHALKRKRLTNAGWVQQFEERFQDFIGGGIAVAVSSCFAALHLSLILKGVGPGDWVIVPALTHCAMANAVEMVGAHCIFIDSHIDSGNIDPDLVENSLHGGLTMTKAVSLVHYLGQPAYMKSMLDICRRWNLPLIEDCALALGTVHNGASKHVGLIGDIGCFSFYPAKHITTGEGGMLVTNDPEISDRARKKRSFGYGHDRDHDFDSPGLNYRMTELQAAMGVAQLTRASKFIHQRAVNAKLLKDALPEFQLYVGNYAVSVMIPAQIDRDKLREKLLSDGIQTSVYYPRPVPHFSYYRKKYGPQRFPVAEDISAHSIALSVGPHLTRDKVLYQAERLKHHVSKW